MAAQSKINMRLVSPLLRTITRSNYYDLFSTSRGGHTPAPLSLLRFLPLAIRGRDRDDTFFVCPECGATSYFSQRRNGCVDCGWEGDEGEAIYEHDRQKGYPIPVYHLLAPASAPASGGI